jgi:stage V sporulation protein G
MEITEVRISPSKGGKVRAYASIVIDDCFIINDIRVMEGRESQYYVTMPARKSRNGQFRDIAHPLNSETRKFVEQKVLEEFEQSIANLVVTEPQGAAGKSKKDKNKSTSPMAKLTNRLFAEDYWTSALQPPEGDDEADSSS